MDENIRRKVCRLIAGIVVVDDDLAPAEDALVDNMMRRFSLPPEERDALFPIMDGDEAAQEFSSLPPDVQQEAFDLLVEAAVADKQFVNEERTYLEKVGKVIGLTSEDIQKRIDKAMA